MRSSVAVLALAVCVGLSWAAPKKEGCYGCVCPAVYEPVCGNNGETYASKCNLGCAQGCNSKIKFASKGECGKKDLKEEETTEGVVIMEEEVTARDEIVDAIETTTASGVSDVQNDDGDSTEATTDKA